MNSKVVSLILIALVLTLYAGPAWCEDAENETGPENNQTKIKIENPEGKNPVKQKNYPILKFLGRPPPDSRPDPSLENLPNPIHVTFKSMIVPGWGQFTNKKYLKGLLFLGFEAAAVMAVIHLQDIADERYEQHLFWSELSIRAYDNGNLDEYNKLQNLADDRYNKYTQNYLGIRNVANTAMVIWLLCSADAYIDAHLRKFMRAKKISTEVKLENSQTKLELSFNF